MIEILNAGIAWKLKDGSIFLKLKKNITFHSLLIVKNKKKAQLAIDPVSKSVQHGMPDYIVHAKMEGPDGNN